MFGYIRRLKDRAERAEEKCRRYNLAVSLLDMWCGHESRHARIIANYVEAYGEGDTPLNAGTPCGDEVCDISGTRMQLRRIDADARSSSDAELSSLAAIMPLRYLDPPDGGAVPLSEQVRRMRQDADCMVDWLAKTEWTQDEYDRGQFTGAAGKHRADVMREEIFRLRGEADTLRCEREELVRQNADLAARLAEIERGEGLPQRGRRSAGAGARSGAGGPAGV